MEYLCPNYAACAWTRAVPGVYVENTYAFHVVRVVKNQLRIATPKTGFTGPGETERLGSCSERIEQ